MIEVVFGIWGVCFILSATLIVFNYNLTRKKLNSNKLRVLNLNLAKIQMYWSNSQSDFDMLTADSVAMDQKKSYKHNFLLAILSIGSLPGFILLLIVIVSMHKLARSRKELRTFRSALAQDIDLSIDQVRSILSEINSV